MHVLVSCRFVVPVDFNNVLVLGASATFSLLHRQRNGGEEGRGLEPPHIILLYKPGLKLNLKNEALSGV